MHTVHRLLLNTALVLLPALFTSCVNMSHGTQLDRTAVSRIRKGVTTRAEVEAMLGTPAYTSMIGDGRRLLCYSHTNTNAAANLSTFIPLMPASATGQTQTQTLQVMVRKSGIVDDYEFNEGTTASHYSESPFSINMSSTPATGR